VTNLYTVSRARRIADLMLGPSLAILGAAFPLYLFARLIPLIPEGIALLRRGYEAWLAAAPLVLILFPFLIIYMTICLRTVIRSWRDAWSTATQTVTGRVTHVSSTPYAFMSGRTFVRGTINHLRIDGRLFVTVPKRVLLRLNVNDVVQVTYTPRVHYVVAIER
jgi:hypothetical protein